MSHIVILGAGVVGLTIALESHKRGFKPVIIARDLPQDSDSTGFASPWAGCLWHPFDHEGTTLGSQCDKETFLKLGELSKEIPDLLKRIDVVDLSKDPLNANEMWYNELVGGMREVAASSSKPLPGDFAHGLEWSTYIWDAPRYIRYLGEQVKSKHIPIFKKRLSSLDEAYDLAALESTFAHMDHVDLVINAMGLGSRSLLGVEDPQVYPAKGQTVLVKAPGVERCYMDIGSSFIPGPDDEPYPTIYIVPRPGTSGEVILGGTFLPNDYTPFPDPAQARRILQSAIKIEPKLVKSSSANKNPTWEDIEVISHNVGLRPCREGGPRIELEHRVLGQGWLGPRVHERLVGKKVGVVHAYGFGPAGYQQSLAAARRALDLAEDFCQSRKTH
ncbi:hypothetical protein BD324DRAFT_619882 [Kockovaella imperatae]|uniref:FAD dependent oxidoreductase domain-containing protein n=1 Tax=Kockovaella imperatae TaxID=4999 RepID=A0A1Y1UJE8_9TREE|nr:hypothetical protein BD324DRAFT_619882 [Kockovaella imperatae]ORX38183.1 hypothetical protein BD324DRAFT_619882 [Kockovaella imperatae]